VKVCYKFDHASIDKIQGNKMLNYLVTVDSITEEGSVPLLYPSKNLLENKTPRGRIGGWQDFTNSLKTKTEIQIEADKQKCFEDLTVFLQEEMNDKLSPIDISLEFSLEDTELTRR